MRLGATLKESLPTFSTAACSPIFCLDFLIRIAEALSKDSLSLDLATPRCSAGKTMRPTTTATRIQTALPSGCVFPARCEKITRRSEAGQVGHRHSKLFTRKIVEPQLPRLPGKLLLRKVEDGDQVLLLVLGPTGLGGRTCPNRTDSLGNPTVSTQTTSDRTPEKEQPRFRFFFSFLLPAETGSLPSKPPQSRL